MVDDEWYSLTEICDLAEKTGFMSVTGRYQCAEAALRELETTRPQAAFIDIELPETDGLTLAEKMLEKDPEIKIVFITGWNQYAVAAFELNALDYIMKPVNPARFLKMTRRLNRRIAAHPKVPAPKLKIRCYGEFQVLIDGEPVIWQRIKAEELFAFLLTRHDSFIHKDVILENLWPNYERSKSLPILQTSVCKIRNLFSSCQDAVHLNYAGNRYALFLTNADCDLLEVEAAWQNGTLINLKNACATFQKGFLPSGGYLWSAGYEESARQKLFAALRKLARSGQTENETQVTELAALLELSCEESQF